jgi:hypothetical protein
MYKPAQNPFPPEETIEQIQAHIKLALAEQKLFLLKTEAFKRYVEGAAIHLKSAKRHAHALPR